MDKGRIASSIRVTGEAEHQESPKSVLSALYLEFLCNDITGCIVYLVYIVITLYGWPTYDKLYIYHNAQEYQPHSKSKGVVFCCSGIQLI